MFYRLTIFLVSAISAASMNAQDEEPLPYHQIPDYPTQYTAATVVARTLDGLGYRYYWATEGLTESDLTYKPSEDSRTIGETLQHLLGLTNGCLSTVKNIPIVRSTSLDESSLQDLREETLQNIKGAADLLKEAPDANLSQRKIIFQRGERTSEFPFWNLLNGQLADALYHTGQIVAFRRAAGNPLPSGVNVFIGKTK